MPRRATTGSQRAQSGRGLVFREHRRLARHAGRGRRRLRRRQQERRRGADADHPDDRLDAQAGARTAASWPATPSPSTGRRPAATPNGCPTPATASAVTNGNTPITWNDPNDANFPTNSTFQQAFVQHLTNRWGLSTNGGVRYYIMDNEHSIWHSTHQDVHPVGASRAGNPRQVLRLRRHGQSARSQRAGAGARRNGAGPAISTAATTCSTAACTAGATIPDRSANGGWDYCPLAAQPVPPARHQHRPAPARLLHPALLSAGAAWAATTSPPPPNCCATAPPARFWDTNYVDESWIGRSRTTSSCSSRA